MSGIPEIMRTLHLGRLGLQDPKRSRPILPYEIIHLTVSVQTSPAPTVRLRHSGTTRLSEPIMESRLPGIPGVMAESGVVVAARSEVQETAGEDAAEDNSETS